jgi:hypothetical protein
MAEESDHRQSPTADYEALKSDLARTLLESNSPVADESAFKKARHQYSIFLEQREKSNSQISSLSAAAYSVSCAEATLIGANANLLTQQNQLLDLASSLGEAAFSSLQSGLIADSQCFTARTELQNRIDSLVQKKSILSLANASGLLEQASLKAKEIKLAGQLKIEQLKINSTNRTIGRLILSSNAEESLRCTPLEKVLEAIASQRKKIAAAKAAREAADRLVSDTRKNTAATLGIPEVSDGTSLESQVLQQKERLRLIDKQIAELEESVVEKALAYDWLQDNPQLRDPLSRLAQVKQQLTPRQLSLWPLATVVVAGHLLANFGSQPLNLNLAGIAILYVITGIMGFFLLAYYKPEFSTRERRFKSLALLFGYSIISVVSLLILQDLAEYAAANWSIKRTRRIGNLPITFLYGIGLAYRDTFAVMFEGKLPQSFPVFFRDHFFSVGLCEELIKIFPTLIAFSQFNGNWKSRGDAFNSKLVYLSMIGGFAFGLGEAVHYHFNLFGPVGAGWGIYALRFLTLVTIHSAWAGISGWILAHVTGEWIRDLSSISVNGLGIVAACLLIALTLAPADLLHTSHNLSGQQTWILFWDVVSLAAFGWVVRCSNVYQLLPNNILRFLRQFRR